MKAKKGDPIKKGLKAKGDFYQSLEPEYKKIYMKHLDDAINRGVSVSDAASSAVFKVNKAKEEAKVAKKNIKNFVGDRKYEDGGKVKKKGKKPNYKKTETFADYKSAAATFQDFDPGKDTVFVGASIDPGVADKKAQRQGNISASKGASSSSYNDTKMYRTKNEAGQDVYVSLRKYDKYKKGGKVFKPHNMYKDGKKVVAKTMADHLRLKKQGYSHKKG